MKPKISMKICPVPELDLPITPDKEMERKIRVRHYEKEQLRYMAAIGTVYSDQLRT